jgi:hypothetical protein
MLPKGQQSELTSYLSRRRNTTGSISLNKIVDLKNTSSGNALKLAAATACSNSNNKLSTESNKKQPDSIFFLILIYLKIDIFQIVEDSDLFATKQLIQANENLVNS